MPIYTYRCKNCGIQFDQQQKFSDAPLTRCPECSKKALYKVFQPVGIVFKGSGFYSTDNRSSSGMSRSSSSVKSGESEGESGASERTTAKNEDKKSNGGTSKDD